LAVCFFASDFPDFEPDGAENYACDLRQERFIVDIYGDVYRRGENTSIGQRVQPGDPDCFFEVVFSDGAYRNRRVCMGDLGNVFMQSARGRRVGECLSCGQGECY